LKNQKYNYFNESGSRIEELSGELEENGKPVFSRVCGLSMKGLYLKRERSLFEVHIVRIKEKGVRKIGKIFERI